MTALERIKQIEKSREPIETCQVKECDHWDHHLKESDFSLLVRAFKVMKAIAAVCKQDAEVRMNDKDLRVPIWIYLEASIEEEFERRMREGE